MGETTNNQSLETKVSVIIPVYNIEEELRDHLSFLWGNHTEMEILLVNDGSEDKTVKICEQLEKEHSQIRLITKEHTGVSDTRNTGIRNAQGKYILFLDADDELSEGAVDVLYDFFEECSDTVDLITYPIVTYFQGRRLTDHFRYQTLEYNGIYDLERFPYIGQTTMNIMVRNRFADNLLFDTGMSFSEDQKYCCRILAQKMKIGFCKDAQYIYYRSRESASGHLNGACYIFEQSMAMFEEIFSWYAQGTVPKAFQGLFINDLEWKMRENILFPWHYDEFDFEDAVDRIKRLLVRVDNDVILKHPQMNYFHKYFWLSLMPNAGVEPYFHAGEFGLREGKNCLLQSNKVEIVVTRIRMDGDTFIFRGFLRSVVFSFSEEPKLFAVSDEERIPLELYPSAHDYYLCHTKTNHFYAFCMEMPCEKVKNLGFRMTIGGQEYNCTYYFMPKAPFSHKTKIYRAVIGEKTVSYNTNRGTYTVEEGDVTEVYRSNQSLVENSHVKKLREAAIELKTREKVWLYYDCSGVERDNGYCRFIEDLKRKDGIQRYYVYDAKNVKSRAGVKGILHKNLLVYGSEEHQIRFLAAEKILTAFIEDNNLIPFNPVDLDYVCDFFGFEVVYLQHGILHASMPWKYTPEIIMADKVCVSTEYEKKLFVQKYHFRDQDVLESLMPRMKLLNKETKPQRRILFAPSWRSYLVGENENGVWRRLDRLFTESDYYIKINEFLTSSELKFWLEKSSFEIDFHLHPIFSGYKEFFKIESERIHLVDKVSGTEQYSAMITDFSSYAFDFWYLERPVFSFVPDEMQFRAGMNSYYEIEKESEKNFVSIKDPTDFIRKEDLLVGKAKLHSSLVWYGIDSNKNL